MKYHNAKIIFKNCIKKKVYTFKNLTIQLILCKSFPIQSFLTGSSSTFPLHWRTQRTKMDYSPLFSTSITVKDKDFLVVMPLQVFNWLKFPHLICNLWTTAFNIQHHHNTYLFMRAWSFQLRPVLALSLFWKILLHKNNRVICSQSDFLWEVILNNLNSYVPNCFYCDTFIWISNTEIDEMIPHPILGMPNKSVFTNYSQYLPVLSRAS